MFLISLVMKSYPDHSNRAFIQTSIQFNTNTNVLVLKILILPIHIFRDKTDRPWWYAKSERAFRRKPPIQSCPLIHSSADALVICFSRRRYNSRQIKSLMRHNETPRYETFHYSIQSHLPHIK